MKFVVYLWVVLASPNGDLISATRLTDEKFYGDSMELARERCRTHGAQVSGEFLNKLFEDKEVQGVAYFACEPKISDTKLPSIFGTSGTNL